MVMRKVAELLLTAACVSLVGTSSARADNLVCYSGQANPQNGEDWQVICAGNSAAYADVQVTPTETGELVTIHVTDHFDCTGGTHLECGFSSSFEGDIECLTEGEPLELNYEGYIPGVYVYCGCYSEGITCLGE